MSGKQYLTELLSSLNGFAGISQDRVTTIVEYVAQLERSAALSTLHIAGEGKDDAEALVENFEKAFFSRCLAETGARKKAYLEARGDLISRLSLSSPGKDGGQEVEAVARCYVGEMKTTAGADYYVVVERDGRQLTPHMHKIRGRAEFEVAEWNWLLNGGEKPDILTFDTEATPASASSTHPPKLELNPIHIRLLKSGVERKWVSLSDDAGRRMAELAALGELERAGLVRPTDEEFPPGPSIMSVRPREITQAGRAALSLQPASTALVERLTKALEQIASVNAEVSNERFRFFALATADAALAAAKEVSAQ